MYGVLVGNAAEPIRRGGRFTTKNHHRQAVTFHAKKQRLPLDAARRLPLEATRSVKGRNCPPLTVCWTRIPLVRLGLPAQPVDTTPSKALTRQSFRRRTTRFAVPCQNLTRAAFLLA